MLIHGSSMSSALLRDTTAADRFWYWRGVSGKSYIHSVYPADACPPLPGAVYVAVKRTGSLRTALSCARFPRSWSAMADFGEADEVHVHLLSTTETEARAVAEDLRAALREDAPYSAGLAA